MLRHDNGLVFGSKLYRVTAKDYGLTQEFVTPYTPEENGLCERLIRTVKQECVWQHRFTSLEQARRVIGKWIEHYNVERPHSSLKYKTPAGSRKRAGRMKICGEQASGCMDTGGALHRRVVRPSSGRGLRGPFPTDGRATQTSAPLTPALVEVVHKMGGSTVALGGDLCPDQ